MTDTTRVCHQCLEDRHVEQFDRQPGYGEVCDLCRAEIVDEEQRAEARRGQWKIIIAAAVVLSVGLGLMIAGTARGFAGSTDDGREPLVVWDEIGGDLLRTATPTGWLVKRYGADHIEYVPDPRHEWGQ